MASLRLIDRYTSIKSRLGRIFSVQDMRRAYCLTFLTPQAKSAVLPDLCEFCHAQEPAPKDGDLFVQGRAAGRRDVWLRIQEHLHLTDEELVAAYAHRLTVTPKDFTR